MRVYNAHNITNTLLLRQRRRRLLFYFILLQISKCCTLFFILLCFIVLLLLLFVYVSTLRRVRVRIERITNIMYMFAHIFHKTRVFDKYKKEMYSLYVVYLPCTYVYRTRVCTRDN